MCDKIEQPQVVADYLSGCCNFGSFDGPPGPGQVEVVRNPDQRSDMRGCLDPDIASLIRATAFAQARRHFSAR